MRNYNRIRRPTLSQFTPPPRNKTGWPWTEESPQLPETMPDGRPWPRISIVTPSYNQGRFIEETIRSVLLQGYPNLEYFIIDGGSTDESVEIIRKYEPWLTYWVSERDKGQSDAINKGFSRSTGEILAWLNSDDIYLPGAFKGAATAIEAHPSASLVYAKSLMTDDRGKTLKLIGEPFDLIMMLTKDNLIPQPSAFIRRRCADQIGLLNLNFHFMMDWDYWLRLSLVGDIWFEDASWSIYKYYHGTKTAIRPRVPAELERKKLYETFFQQNNLPENIARLRPVSLMWINLICAEHYYIMQRLNEARHHTFQALKANWRALFLSEWQRRLIRDLIGPTRIDRIKQIIKRW